ncbi:MAG: hypothetical protein EOP83_27345 [Verrucomicrobiaceae bacterium]|nr:MAG: hypothetical protein EOP83_27345 [Verrucomicrobiaceae bacterium]
MIFETLRGGQWEPTFGIEPASDWFDAIFDEKYGNGAIALMFSVDGQTAPRWSSETNKENWTEANWTYDRGWEYFSQMELAKATAEYGEHPSFKWDYRIPRSSRHRAVIQQRHHRWFNMISSVFAGLKFDDPNEIFFVSRGLPEDCHVTFRHAHARMADDAHAASWLMVSEILDDQRVINAEIADLDAAGTEEAVVKSPIHPHLQWLRQHIEEPTQTRMVFFFS